MSDSIKYDPESIVELIKNKRNNAKPEEDNKNEPIKLRDSICYLSRIKINKQYFSWGRKCNCFITPVLASIFFMTFYDISCKSFLNDEKLKAEFILIYIFLLLYYVYRLLYKTIYINILTDKFKFQTGLFTSVKGSVTDIVKLELLHFPLELRRRTYSGYKHIGAYQLNAILRSGEKYNIAYDLSIFSLAKDVQELAEYLNIPYYEDYTDYNLDGMGARTLSLIYVNRLDRLHPVIQTMIKKYIEAKVDINEIERLAKSQPKSDNVARTYNFSTGKSTEESMKACRKCGSCKIILYPKIMSSQKEYRLKQRHSLGSWSYYPENVDLSDKNAECFECGSIV